MAKRNSNCFTLSPFIQPTNQQILKFQPYVTLYSRDLIYIDVNSTDIEPTRTIQ